MNIFFLVKRDQNGESNVQFKNIRLYPIFNPTVILKYQETQNLSCQQSTPKIIFAKVNLAKYRINVRGAKTPYILIFSENFNKGWKAYFSNTKARKEDDKIVVNYFDGDVKQGISQNVFLNRNTFETWDKRAIPEKHHLLVNGYANAWYVTPQDTGGREDYEIIVEFQPQRMFYLGAGISLFTFLSCCGYLGLSFIKRRLRK